MGSASVGEVASAFKGIARELMFLMCFGLVKTEKGFERLAAIYREITADKLLSTFDAQRFKGITELIRPLARENRVGLLQYLHRTGTLDETATGNVALLAEIGRYDLVGLWVWIFKMLGENPSVLDSLRPLPRQDGVALSEAVVLEALRLERSEFLMRTAKVNIVFDGHLIPANTDIRIAVWEAHKDPAHFPDPFRFDPQRFVGKKPPADHYASLGIGIHRCLGAEWTVSLTAAMVRAVASRCEVKILADGKVRRETYHFAPSGKLRFGFQPLANVGGD